MTDARADFEALSIEQWRAEEEDRLALGITRSMRDRVMLAMEHGEVAPGPSGEAPNR